jgi:hypothetical protein
MVYVMTLSPIHLFEEPERPHILRSLGPLACRTSTPPKRKKVMSRVNPVGGGHPITFVIAGLRFEPASAKECRVPLRDSKSRFNLSTIEASSWTSP